MGILLEHDKMRYHNEKIPGFQRSFRLAQECKNPYVRCVYRAVYSILRRLRGIEIPCSTQIGGGCTSVMLMVSLLTDNVI